MKRTGFTEEELAAARWNKKHLKSNDKRKHSSKKSRHRSLSSSRSKERYEIIPKNPRNPLLDAYEKPLKIKKNHSTNKIEKSRWTHEKFFERSPSPPRERTTGHHWNTRKGAWKSKAGGIYLPPSPNSDSEDNEDYAKYRIRWTKSQRHDRQQERFKNDDLQQRSPTPIERASPVYE